MVAAVVPAWAPLREARFRSTWGAFLGAQVVTWALTVGAIDVIERQTDSAAALAGVQAAISLPGVLLALLAGTIADLVDRRRLLVVASAVMVAATALLAVGSGIEGMTSPLVVLALTAVMGGGLALLIPTFLAMVPDLVPRSMLVAAVSISGVSVNLARAVGPALAGAAIALFGAGGLFWLLTGLLVAVVGVLVAWGPRSPAPPERTPVMAAAAEGVRYARDAPALRRVMLRTALVVVPGSALWALIPVIAVQRLGMDGSGSGALLACVGAGAVVAALLVPLLGAHASLDALCVMGAVLLAAVLAALVVTATPVTAGAVLVFAGVAWITVLTAMNTAAHTVTHDWVRGRAMALWLVIYQAGLGIGSLLWGLVAEAHLDLSLLLAAGSLAAGALAARLLPLPPGAGAMGLDPAAT